MVKTYGRSAAALLLCMLLLAAAALPAGAEEYRIQGKTEIVLPLPGYEPGMPSNNCFTFALSIYQAVWGVSFTGANGTPDDMLRSVPMGEQRAITAENTKKYISAAAPGATVRVAMNPEGDDAYGTGYRHSFILIGKDENGFTSYEGSVNGKIRIKYFTWSEYAEGYFGKNYKYFKYIKWPGAPAYGEPADPSGGNTDPDVPPDDTDPVDPVDPVGPLGETPETPENPAERLPGDADGSGDVTAADARFVLRVSVGLEDAPPESELYAACDFDGDGEVTAADARAVLRLAVGLSPEE